jgi:hypothetical protein
MSSDIPLGPIRAVDFAVSRYTPFAMDAFAIRTPARATTLHSLWMPFRIAPRPGHIQILCLKRINFILKIAKNLKN